ncbi:MAG TPA: DUF6513 domain-containing protein [Gemmatales bacterium]|nr:DUF6513 domain-containing protein [Gemmatales bacterium]
MPRYLFITGKLAEPSLREVLRTLAPQAGFDYEVLVLNITVAALMTPEWVSRRLQIPEGIDHIYVPGACSGDWSILEKATGIPVTAGPADVRDLPDLFGQHEAVDYGRYDIAIIAEINHAPRLTLDELVQQAMQLQKQGADLIDLGCEPGSTWGDLPEAVKALKDLGLRLSIDTFNLDEATAGAKAGAELILSVNSANREACRDWGCEVVAIPDAPHELDTLNATVEYLTTHKVPHRLDPILEPIGFGFAASLVRYHQTRLKYPQHEMMMGIGNLSELTETDSGPINLLLLSICQEWDIRSVLTTAVANFARSSIAECDLARRLAYYAVYQKRLPKKIDSRLLTLRDRKLRPKGQEILSQLAASLTDPNYRLFAEEGQLHAMNGQMHLKNTDPFVLFQELCKRDPKMDPAHAFYLGYELSKAVTALTLGKNYVQDQALNWGHLTVPEVSHRERQRQRKQGGGNAAG